MNQTFRYRFMMRVQIRQGRLFILYFLEIDIGHFVIP
jgi:hypothetical protein